MKSSYHVRMYEKEDLCVCVCVCVCVCIEVLRPGQSSGAMLSAVSLPYHTFRKWLLYKRYTKE